VVVVTTASSFTPVITDTFGNTYTNIFQGVQLSTTVTAQTRFYHMFYCAKGTGGTNHVITATYDSDYPSVYFTEIVTGGNGNGIALDTYTTNPTGTSPYTGTSITTSAVNEIILSFVALNSFSTTVTMTPGVGYTKINEQKTLGYVVGATAYQYANTIGSYGASWTASASVDTSIAIVAFKAA
jgi:hypothetical protein